jgi:hypothetical protein
MCLLRRIKTLFNLLNLLCDAFRSPLKCGRAIDPGRTLGLDQGKPRGPASDFQIRPNDQGGPLSFEGLAGGLRPPPHSRSAPGYGREPVGNGHAAAGFSAVRALGVAAVDAGDAATDLINPAELALGLTGFAFFFLANFFFRPAAFFLDDFLAAFFFFFDDFFFFFFLPPFFAFFFAMTSS